jgi:hypothetical protein
MPMIKLVCLGLIAVVAVLLAILEKRREPRGRKVRWASYGLILLAAITTFVPELLGYIDQQQSERKARDRHAELMRAERSSGTILPPTTGAQSDVVELTIGDNTLTCPAHYAVDLVQVLRRFCPFPLAEQGPYLMVVNKGDQLSVSATLTDKNGSILGVLHDNVFVFEPPRPLSVVRRANQVTVRDTDGTTLLDVALTSAHAATVRGVFYTPSYRCVMNDKGIVCDAVSDKASIKKIEISGSKFRVVPSASKPAE